MMRTVKYLLCFLITLPIIGWGSFVFAYGTLHEELTSIQAQARDLDPEVLRLSLRAYSKARNQGLDEKQLLTIIDFSKPSSERRLWVLDLKHNRVLFDTWVSHGKNSGELNATSFSNQGGSLKSSIGVFVTTGKPYVGGEGYSLRIRGLERGINDNAYRRDIVFHGAWYVSPDVIRRYGQLGRSWGCPAVNDKLAPRLIDTIKENTLVLMYYPDRRWLQQSNYV